MEFIARVGREDHQTSGQHLGIRLLECDGMSKPLYGKPLQTKRREAKCLCRSRPEHFEAATYKRILAAEISETQILHIPQPLSTSYLKILSPRHAKCMQPFNSSSVIDHKLVITMEERMHIM